MFDKLEKMEKMVQKGNWDKLKQKFMRGSDEERRNLAKACGKADSVEDNACNILITLITDADPQVQLEAVKSLGLIGNDHATAHLQRLLGQLNDSQTELKDAIHTAIKSVQNKK